MDGWDGTDVPPVIVLVIVKDLLLSMVESLLSFRTFVGFVAVRNGP